MKPALTVWGERLRAGTVPVVRGLPWVADDGGRARAPGFGGTAPARDCVPRAIAIAAERPYATVYAELAGLARVVAEARRRRRLITGERRDPGPARAPRSGVEHKVTHAYLEDHLGWTWTPTMSIGSGTTVHLREGELPAGRLVVQCSRHLVAVIDGVVHDTADPCRGGTRAVYGYWSQP